MRQGLPHMRWVDPLYGGLDQYSFIFKCLSEKVKPLKIKIMVHALIIIKKILKK